MITRDTKLTKFTIKPLDTIVSSAFGAEELFANVRHFEVIAVEKDLHTRKLLKLVVKSQYTSRLGPCIVNVRCTMNGQGPSLFPWLRSWDPRMIDRHWPSHRQKIHRSLPHCKSPVTMETWKLKGSVTHADASTLQEEKEFFIIDSWSEFLTEVNVIEESSAISKAGAKNLCKWKLVNPLQ